ncbi:hypothetical protein QBC45DRAFT_73013 [Copromyces sp. CBS 386.78]|nr:hypothetical protein QBC45DRAFT_73013 [Copromyces sp. CBS 386.78]
MILCSCVVLFFFSWLGCVWGLGIRLDVNDGGDEIGRPFLVWVWDCGFYEVYMLTVISLNVLSLTGP